jgi:hypothetical protein
MLVVLAKSRPMMPASRRRPVPLAVSDEVDITETLPSRPLFVDKPTLRSSINVHKLPWKLGDAVIGRSFVLACR